MLLEGMVFKESPNVPGVKRFLGPVIRDSFLRMRPSSGKKEFGRRVNKELALGLLLDSCFVAADLLFRVESPGLCVMLV